MTEEKGKYRAASRLIVTCAADLWQARVRAGNQAASRLVVTCADNSEIENQLSVGSRYEVQTVTRYGRNAYYRVRNDSGDLADYGTHRFDVQVEA